MNKANDNLTNDRYSVEAFKTLRTNIGFCGDDIKVIAVTSTIPHEGKSEVLIRLAHAYAETGAKTLLLDADIRNSILPGKLGIREPRIGLTHIMSGKEKDPDRAVVSTTQTNLDIIFAGPNAPDPAKLFESSNFKALVKYLRNKYEYIVIDCPPLMPVIDAAIIGNECDGTILVVSQNETKKRAAKKVLAQLELSGTKVLGAVLNKVQRQSKGYGYGYGYGYGHEYGYGNRVIRKDHV